MLRATGIKAMRETRKKSTTKSNQLSVCYKWIHCAQQIYALSTAELTSFLFWRRRLPSCGECHTNKQKRKITMLIKRLQITKYTYFHSLYAHSCELNWCIQRLVHAHTECVCVSACAFVCLTPIWNSMWIKMFAFLCKFQNNLFIIY